jgi:hypothetical protein
MDRAFHSADNTRRDISGVKDILTQLSTISRDSYQEWIEYLRSYYSSFDLLHDWATLPFYRRWRRTREIKQERLRAEFKNALLCSQKRMPGMEKLNAPRRAPRQHIQPNERNVVAWDNGRFGNRKGQAPMPNVGLKKYVARFALVIGVPEYNTSKTCACDRPTDEYLVSFRCILPF